MLSTARCKVQTHYGQVLAYKTPQSREECEQSSHCCSSPHKNIKVYYCFLQKVEKLHIMPFKSKQRICFMHCEAEMLCFQFFSIYIYKNILDP